MPWHACLDSLTAPDREGRILPVMSLLLIPMCPHLLFEPVDFITGSTAVKAVCRS